MVTMHLLAQSIAGVEFAGVERESQDGVQFCGEHTSIDAQGYLEGAVETGERAADEIISALS